MVLVELGAEVAADGVEAGLALLRLDGVQAEALGDEIEILLQMLFAQTTRINSRYRLVAALLKADFGSSL